MQRRQKRLPPTLAQLRQRAGARLQGLPPSLLREAQKRGFPDMRSIILPPAQIRTALTLPLLRDLLVTRIGYCARAAGHDIPRPEGSLDHILQHCVAGQGWLKMAGQDWEVPANCAVFIPNGVPHRYGADARHPWSIYWIHFTGRQAADYFQALQVSASAPLLHLPCTAELLSAFQEIEGCLADVHTSANLIAGSTALARFLGLIARQRSAMEHRERSEEENIQQTIEFMQRHVNRWIALPELAQLAHMSVSRYESAFVRRTGCAPIRYFNRMRLQQAARRMVDSQAPVNAIARDLGFDDPYYFSRAFKRLIGQSPSQYRRAHPYLGRG